jgi:hypothetical protein
VSTEAEAECSERLRLVDHLKFAATTTVVAPPRLALGAIVSV